MSTPALSKLIQKTCDLTIKVSSTTENSYWHTIVQAKNAVNKQYRLLANYTFGRAQDPYVYPEQKIRLLPFDVLPCNIQIYWKDNADINYPVKEWEQSKWNLAVRYEEKYDSSGQLIYVYASYWDQEDAQNSEIHLVELSFNYNI